MVHVLAAHGTEVGDYKSGGTLGAGGMVSSTGAHDGLGQLTSGTLEALCDEGDIILVEDPTYFVFLSILQSRGIRARGSTRLPELGPELNAQEWFSINARPFADYDGCHGLGQHDVQTPPIPTFRRLASIRSFRERRRAAIERRIL